MPDISKEKKPILDFAGLESLNMVNYHERIIKKAIYTFYYLKRILCWCGMIEWGKKEAVHFPIFFSM